jgi:hypothetical protein
MEASVIQTLVIQTSVIQTSVIQTDSLLKISKNRAVWEQYVAEKFILIMISEKHEVII